MILTINKWGNSQGIRFPKDLLKKLHAQIGSSLKVEIQDGKIILEPVFVPKIYDIHELAKQIEVVEKQEEVSWGVAEGKEIW